MDTLPSRLHPGTWAIDADGLLLRRVGPWAKEKLFYIGRYIDIFNSGMKRKWARRVYLDLFSGPGRVLIDAKEEADGSALLALGSKVPFTDIFYNDIEPLAIEALNKRSQRQAPTTAIECLSLDCNVAAVEIRKRLPPNSLDLAFIDPTNWQITFDTITRLTADRRMDLIITFHVGGRKRAATYAPESLDAFFGTPAWRNAYDKSLRAGQREGGRILLDCYKEQLRRIGYKWTVDDIRITNTTHVGLYHLVFASKSARGEDFWKKITDRSAGGQMHLFREARAPYDT